MIILSDHIHRDPFVKEDCKNCKFSVDFHGRTACTNNDAAPYIIENKKCGAKKVYDPYAEVMI